MESVTKQIQMRRGTTDQWQFANPVLANGEQGLDTTLRRKKIGDGVTAWNDLEFDEPREAIEQISADLEFKADISATANINRRGFNFIVDDSTYSAFPSVDVLDGVVYAVYKQVEVHVGEGRLMLTKSFDGGTTWTTPAQMIVSGSPIFGVPIEIGVASNNRLIIGYNPYGGAHTKFAYSDDFAATWTLAATILPPAGFLTQNLHGAIIRQKGGRLIAPYFAGTTGAHGTPARSGFFDSLDNGLTWRDYTNGINAPVMIEGIRNAAFASLGALTEVSICVINDGASDMESTLIAIVRDDQHFHYHHFLVSTDGGTNWTNLGKAFGEQNTGSGYSYPVNLFRDGDDVYAILGRRQQGSGNIPQSIRLWRAKAADVVTTGWGDYRVLFHGISSYKAHNQNDFGYPRIFRTPYGSLKYIFYDTSINFTPRTEGYTNKTALVVGEIETRVMMEAFRYNADGIFNTTVNNSAVSQQMYDVTIDTHRARNADGFVYVPKTGWYTVSIQGHLEAGSDATFFAASVEAVDVAALTAISAGGAVWTEARSRARRVIAYVAFAPSAVEDLNKYVATGTAFLHKGVRLEYVTKRNGTGLIKLIYTEFRWCMKMRLVQSD